MEDIRNILDRLASAGNLRELAHAGHLGKYISIGGDRMLNLSSNDYLGLASDLSFYRDFVHESGLGEFLRTISLDISECGYVPEDFMFSSSSSRLLTGNFSVYDKVETELAALYGAEAALFAGSGYHLNTGILSAVAGQDDLILADKLVHASIIDGMQLSKARTIRFRHQDLWQLEELLSRYHSRYEKIIVVTESIFSMDGDITDLQRLVSMKKSYPGILLYVDEAHGVGVRGMRGLGLAEECGCMADIDFLCGTMGKALASAGAFVICSRMMKEFLVNRMRTFIFTTALPPANMLWTLFVIRKLSGMAGRRAHLERISSRLREALSGYGYESHSGSQIVPVMAGSSDRAVRMAAYFRENGFYLLPVRPPSVPEGTSRLRISLTAAIDEADVDRLVFLLSDMKL